MTLLFNLQNMPIALQASWFLNIHDWSTS